MCIRDRKYTTSSVPSLGLCDWIRSRKNTLASNNYFKAGNGIVLFDDTDRDSVETAWNVTQEVVGDIEFGQQHRVTPVVVSAWRQPKHAGPWSQVDLVGHRSERMILDDIRTTEGALRFNPPNPVELEADLSDLQAELTDRRRASGWSSN